CEDFVCPSNIVVTTASGQSMTNISWTAPTVVNCPMTGSVCTPPSGSSFSTGVSTVTCMATDAEGTNITCSFTVTVNSPPVAGADVIQRFPTVGVRVLQSALLANDTDPDAGESATLTITAVSPTSTNGGPVAIIGNYVYYTPLPGY